MLDGSVKPVLSLLAQTSPVSRDRASEHQGESLSLLHGRVSYPWPGTPRPCRPRRVVQYLVRAEAGACSAGHTSDSAKFTNQELIRNEKRPSVIVAGAVGLIGHSQQTRLFIPDQCDAT